MAYLQLTSGAYQSRAVIAAAQRCLNLYPEKSTAGGEPSPIAHLPTPGLVRLSVAPYERIRCLYRATTGDLYACADQGIYYVSPTWQWNLIGSITPSDYTDVVPRHNVVSMCDNGTMAIVCDGSVDGFRFNVQTKSGFERIPAAGYDAVDAFGTTYTTGWYGSTRIDYLDTYFLANKPGTPIWYISLSETADFDALDFASHVAFGDTIQVVVSMKRNVWAIGKFSTEIWYNSGGGGSGNLSSNTFAFDILPTYHDVGIIAPYSLCRVSDQLFWLSCDAAGQGIIIQGSGYDVKRISTHAIEAEISKYSNIEDCVGWTYQQQGHVFVGFTFGTADKTWVYDLLTQAWHERAWIDPQNGHEHKWRPNQIVNAYDTVVAGDWVTGDLYKVDPTVFTDAIPGGVGSGPIKRVRSFPHILDGTMARRQFFKRVIANVAVGTSRNVSPEEDVIRAAFTATDGTLIENYASDLDLHGSFTSVGSGEAEVLGDQFVAVESGTSPAYQANTVPTSPNYTVRFRCTPSDFDDPATDGSDVWAMGRATDVDHGYRAGISSDGTHYSVFLTGGEIDEAVQFGAYTDFSAGDSFMVYFDLIGTSLTVSLNLPNRNVWIDSAGAQNGTRVSAIAATDATYSQPGKVIIGGDWVEG